MAILGTGTQEDPYLVYTALELRQALGETMAYVKLNNDIDCNIDCRIWNELTVNATDLNLNEHSIMNTTCRGGYVFYIPTGSMHLFKIHDGWMNNMTLSGASFINTNVPANITYTANNQVGNYGTVIENSAILTNVDEINLNGSTLYFWGRGVRFYNSVWKGKLQSASGSACIGSNDTIINEGILFEESRMSVQTNIPAGSGTSRYVSGVNGHFIGSQVDVVTNMKEFNSYALGSNSSINNSVLNIKSLTGESYSFPYLVSSSNAIGINTYNKDYINITGTTDWAKQTHKGLTSAEMINSDANNAVGFSNIKVDPITNEAIS